MIALKHSDKLFREIRELKEEISSFNQSSFFLRIHSFFFKRRNITQLKNLKKRMIFIRDRLIQHPELEVDADLHDLIKDMLSTLKQAVVLCQHPLLTNEKMEVLFKENILFAYKIEKLVRIKLYSNQNSKNTSDFAKAVSSLSLDTTAKNT